MDRITKFKKALEQYFSKKKNQKNDQIIDGWYSSYQPIEKYAFNDVDKTSLADELKQNIFYQIQRPRSKRWAWYSAAAAVITVAFVATWVVKKPVVTQAQMLSSTTETGILKYLVLQDSTEVWLNASSKLNFPEKFTDTSRLVSLPEGEAFFQVKRDTIRPFTVQVGKLQVRVLGTSFNISNYATLKNQVITVNTGRVQISEGKKILAVLEKGKQITYHKASGDFELNNVNQLNSFSWKDGESVLHDASIEELSQVFKGWYGLHLRSKLSEISNYHYNLTIQRNISAEENLKMICKMHHINYRKEGNVIELY